MCIFECPTEIVKWKSLQGFMSGKKGDFRITRVLCFVTDIESVQKKFVYDGINVFLQFQDEYSYGGIILGFHCAQEAG